MRRALYHALTALLLGASATSAQTPVTRQQLNGEWTGTLVLDNSSPRLALVFRATDSTLTGTVFADADSIGPMQDLSLVGNRVHFKVDRFDFTGIVTGSSMKIDLIVINGSTRTFTAKKTPDPVPRSFDGAVQRARLNIVQAGSRAETHTPRHETTALIRPVCICRVRVA